MHPIFLIAPPNNAEKMHPIYQVISTLDGKFMLQTSKTCYENEDERGYNSKFKLGK